MGAYHQEGRSKFKKGAAGQFLRRDAVKGRRVGTSNTTLRPKRALIGNDPAKKRRI